MKKSDYCMLVAFVFLAPHVGHGFCVAAALYYLAFGIYWITQSE
jgi:hypothetical protein